MILSSACGVSVVLAGGDAGVALHLLLCQTSCITVTNLVVRFEKAAGPWLPSAGKGRN